MYPATLPSHSDRKHIDLAIECLKKWALFSFAPNLVIFLPR